MIEPTAHTLGWYYRQPGVSERITARRHEAALRFRAAVADLRQRQHVLTVLVSISYTVNGGRRLDVIARELRDLAEDCDQFAHRLASAA